MGRMEISCVLCFLLLLGEYCVVIEGTKVPEGGVDGKTETLVEAESGMRPRFHRLPPPEHMQGPPPSSEHMMPSQSESGHEHMFQDSSPPSGHMMSSQSDPSGSEHMFQGPPQGPRHLMSQSESAGHEHMYQGPPQPPRHMMQPQSEPPAPEYHMQRPPLAHEHMMPPQSHLSAPGPMMPPQRYPSVHGHFNGPPPLPEHLMRPPIIPPHMIPSQIDQGHRFHGPPQVPGFPGHMIPPHNPPSLPEHFMQRPPLPTGRINHPPAHRYQGPPQIPENNSHPPNHPQMDFYPIVGSPQKPQQYYSYNQGTQDSIPEDETLQEMKQTVAAFTKMQKEFINSFRTLQEPQVPIIELPAENMYEDVAETEEDRESRKNYPRSTLTDNIKGVFGKVRRKKMRPTSTTTVVTTGSQPVQQGVMHPLQQTMMQPVQQTMMQPIQQAVMQPIQQAVMQPVQQAVLQPVQQAVVQPVQTTALSGLGSLKLRNLLGRTTSVSNAEQTFDGIRSEMLSAIWTGVIVAVVKLAPLILSSIKLIFRAILPLVGMSLINRTSQDVASVQSVVQPVVQPAFSPVVQPAFAPVVQPAFSPVQPAFSPVVQPAFQPAVQPGFQPLFQPAVQPGFQRPAQFMPIVSTDTTTTVQQDLTVDDGTLLDNEFDNIKRSFYK